MTAARARQHATGPVTRRGFIAGGLALAAATPLAQAAPAVAAQQEGAWHLGRVVLSLKKGGATKEEVATFDRLDFVLGLETFRGKPSSSSIRLTGGSLMTARLKEWHETESTTYLPTATVDVYSANGTLRMRWTLERAQVTRLGVEPSFQFSGDPRGGPAPTKPGSKEVPSQKPQETQTVTGPDVVTELELDAWKWSWGVIRVADDGTVDEKPWPTWNLQTNVAGD